MGALNGSDIKESRERVAADFEALLDDTENLLRAVAGAGGETMKTARSRIESRIDELREILAAGQDSALGEVRSTIKDARVAAKRADKYVHQNPWPAIGGALLIGVGLGLLGRRIPTIAQALTGLD